MQVFETTYNTKTMSAVESLKSVLDPELGLNIVDLGLLYSVNFNELNKEILVNMTLTSQFCPIGESILGSVEQQLKFGFPQYKTQVNLTFEPAWNSTMISEDGIKQLKLKR